MSLLAQQEVVESCSQRRNQNFWLGARKLFGRKNPKAKFHYLPSCTGSHINPKWLEFFHKNSWHSWRKDLRLQPGVCVSYFNVCNALSDSETTQRYPAFCLLYKDSVSLTESSRFHGTVSKVQLHVSVSHKETCFPISYIKLSL